MVSFGVGVAENGSTYDNRGYRISVNGEPTNFATPFFAPGNSLGTPIPYGTPNTQVKYHFTIVDEQNFTIQNVYGSKKATIARTQLDLMDSNTDKPYTFQLIFRNLSDSHNFNLYLEGKTYLRSIPYILEFNGDRVYGNEATTWTVQGNKTHIKDIFVTQINEIDADNAVAGVYRDTISVEIIPPDTI